LGWQASGPAREIESKNGIAPDRLWQRNNNAGYSAGAEQPDRLTLPVNSAQIGLARWGFFEFSRAGALFRIGLHALPISLASK
jgi:hypothetical protein